MNKRRKSYSAYSSSKPKRFFTNRLMSLFVVMIVGVLIFYYLISRYQLIQEAYQMVEMDLQVVSQLHEGSDTGIEQQEQAIANKESLTFLIVGVDYGHVGRLDEQRADVLIALSLNPATGESIQVNLSRLLKLEDEALPLSETYSEGGLESVHQAVNKLLQVPINFTVLIDLSESRELIEALGDNEVEIQEDFVLESQTLNSGDSISLNGRESILFMHRNETDSDWTNGQRQTQIVTSMGQNLFRHLSEWLGMFQSASYFTAAEGIVETDLNFKSFLDLLGGNYITALEEVTVIDLTGTLQEVELEEDGETLTYERVNHSQLERVRQKLQEVLSQ